MIQSCESLRNGSNAGWGKSGAIYVGPRESEPRHTPVCATFKRPAYAAAIVVFGSSAATTAAFAAAPATGHFRVAAGSVIARPAARALAACANALQFVPRLSLVAGGAGGGRRAS